LAQAEKQRAAAPHLIKEDYAAYQSAYARCFAAFPKTLAGLLERGLVYGRYSATAKGIEATRQNLIRSTDSSELVRNGYLQVEGLRYEDFLPFSAAGIFASNLGQYGTKSTAADKPVYTQHTLEEIMGLEIIDPNVTYAGLEAESLLKAYAELGKLNDIPVEERNQWELVAAAYRATS
jgi:uncharacterized glyoxalase superfamily metalloenzyme YdcJ